MCVWCPDPISWETGEDLSDGGGDNEEGPYHYDHHPHSKQPHWIPIPGELGPPQLQVRVCERVFGECVRV